MYLIEGIWFGASWTFERGLRVKTQGFSWPGSSLGGICAARGLQITDPA